MSTIIPKLSPSAIASNSVITTPMSTPDLTQPVYQTVLSPSTPAPIPTTSVATAGTGTIPTAAPVLSPPVYPVVSNAPPPAPVATAATPVTPPGAAPALAPPVYQAPAAPAPQKTADIPPPTVTDADVKDYKARLAAQGQELFNQDTGQPLTDAEIKALLQGQLKQVHSQINAQRKAAQDYINQREDNLQKLRLQMVKINQTRPEDSALYKVLQASFDREMAFNNQLQEALNRGDFAKFNQLANEFNGNYSYLANDIKTYMNEKLSTSQKLSAFGQGILLGIGDMADYAIEHPFKTAAFVGAAFIPYVGPLVIAYGLGTAGASAINAYSGIMTAEAENNHNGIVSGYQDLGRPVGQVGAMYVGGRLVKAGIRAIRPPVETTPPPIIPEGGKPNTAPPAGPAPSGTPPAAGKGTPSGETLTPPETLPPGAGVPKPTLPPELKYGGDGAATPLPPGGIRPGEPIIDPVGGRQPSPTNPGGPAKPVPENLPPKPAYPYKSKGEANGVKSALEQGRNNKLFELQLNQQAIAELMKNGNTSPLVQARIRQLSEENIRLQSLIDSYNQQINQITAWLPTLPD